MIFALETGYDEFRQSGLACLRHVFGMGGAGEAPGGGRAGLARMVARGEVDPRRLGRTQAAYDGSEMLGGGAIAASDQRCP